MRNPCLQLDITQALSCDAMCNLELHHWLTGLCWFIERFVFWVVFTPNKLYFIEITDTTEKMDPLTPLRHIPQCSYSHLFHLFLLFILTGDSQDLFFLVTDWTRRKWMLTKINGPLWGHWKKYQTWEIKCSSYICELWIASMDSCYHRCLTSTGTSEVNMNSLAPFTVSQLFSNYSSWVHKCNISLRDCLKLRQHCGAVLQ